MCLKKNLVMPGIFVCLGDLASATQHDLDHLGGNSPHATLAYTGRHFPEAELRQGAAEAKVLDRLLNATIEFRRTAETDTVNRPHETFTRHYVTVRMSDVSEAKWRDLQAPFLVGKWRDKAKCCRPHTTLGWYKSAAEAERKMETYAAACAHDPYVLTVTGIYFD